MIEHAAAECGDFRSEGASYALPTIDLEGDGLSVLSSLTSETRTARESLTRRCRILVQQGFTQGLAEEVVLEEERVLFRHWIVDNSGSMLSCDGHVIRGRQNKARLVTTTRWAELQETIEYHAEMSGLMEATSFFNLMNSPIDPGVPKLFSVAADANNIPHEVVTAKRSIRKCQPFGPSPITPLLTKIRDTIAVSTDQLRENGKKAVIVLATDGLPTDSHGTYSVNAAQEFMDVLFSMMHMPIWVVIRLCTDDPEVCKFYNALDCDLELPLEVLGDPIKSSTQVGEHNPWLNYAMPLHRIRERGSQSRVFDILDERPLNKDEVCSLLAIIFGKARIANTPDIHDDWKGFIRALGPIVKQEGTIWNPKTKKLEPWIDIRRLDRTFGQRTSFLRRLSASK